MEKKKSIFRLGVDRSVVELSNDDQAKQGSSDDRLHPWCSPGLWQGGSGNVRLANVGRGGAHLGRLEPPAPRKSCSSSEYRRPGGPRHEGTSIAAGYEKLARQVEQRGREAVEA